MIDGSTSKTPTRIINGKSNGRLAAEIVKAYVLSLTKDCTISEFCEGITLHLQQLYEQKRLYSLLATHPEMRATASAAIFNTLRREIWLIGDCQAMIDGVLYDNEKPYEHDIAAQRAQMIQHGKSPLEARKAIEPCLVKAMTEGQNKTYAVIDGFPIFMKGTRLITVPPEAREIVLATDGYPFLMPTLVESEQKLATQLNTDPQNINTFLATKGLVEGNCSFDDRTYLRLALYT